MIQEVYQKAIKYASNKHKSQLVPGTESNYLLHLSNVAMEVICAHKANSDFDLEYAVQVALLHDVIEDTATPLQEIEELFGSAVTKGVDALTKNEEIDTKTEQIRDSLERISQLQKEVSIVKLADRITNLQPPPNHWDKDKIQAYRKDAIMIADALRGKNSYLDHRIQEKIEAYKVY